MTRVALPAACVLTACSSVAVASSRSTPPTTYGSVSTIAAAVDLAAGVSLLVAAAVTAVVSVHRSVAWLTAALGAAWLAPDWIGWGNGNSFARSTAMVAAPFLAPLLAHLVFAYPTGRVRTRWPRRAVVLAYVATASVTFGRALVRDPFRDVHCWDNCTDNVFLVHSSPVAVDVFRLLGAVVAVAVGVLVATAGAHRMRTATRVAASSIRLVVIPASGAVLVGSSVAVAGVVATEAPQSSTFMTMFVTHGVLLVVVALSVLWGTLRTVRRQLEVSHLTAISSEDSQVGAVWPRAFGDEGILVAFWLPSIQQHVDASGRVVEPRPEPGQATTTLVRNGAPIALLIHDQTSMVPSALGPAARLAIDNKRLHAEVLAQLGATREAQRRLVATADTTRRRIERDIHDVAQQHLLAACSELRLGEAKLCEDGDVEQAGLLSAVADRSEGVLGELRDVAHGIFPAILSQAGLGSALRALTEAAPLPVELGTITPHRYVSTVETMVYLIVGTTIQDAHRRGVQWIAADVVDLDDHIHVELRLHGGTGPPQIGVDTADRASAIGGQLRLGRDFVIAELPCE